ncbi:TauD/TfdA family dioxygenase [Streptomyces xanthophaeus]|uniref:TauD/TfdA family dioxygenase n=1 Tax=Streptomyces xanthophaeus TaxID=67385 RepID=UPI00341DE1BF
MAGDPDARDDARHPRSSAVAADWALDPADADACGRLARTLCTGGHDQVDSHEWVAGARDAWEDLPLPLRRRVRRFRRHSGPHGTLVIGGLPVDHAALPATPSVPGSVQRRATVPAAVLTLVTTPLTPRAAAALTEFGRACEATARTLRLTPGDLVVIDNRVTVHGRTAFQPRYDGADRRLQRTYVTTDLRRSRGHRPHDGHVLAR